jgi:deoxyribodipyrimidine photolyase-related protein
MAEVAEEATHVWSHKARIAIFLSAMRHFRDWLRQQGYTVHYHALDDPQNGGSFATELARAIRTHQPQKLIVVEPGEYRVLQSLLQTAQQLGVPLEVRPDRHFLITLDEFRQHAATRKQLRLEFFYREMRQRMGILMDGKQPVGGAWNFDAENRQSFGKQGAGLVPQPIRFMPDAITQEVIRLVEARFPNHPAACAISIGRSPPKTPNARWTTSSKTACRCSVPTKTRCGRASRTCTTRACRQRST